MPLQPQMTEFGPLEQFFAESMLKKIGSQEKEAALSLSRLMQASRAGHLCQTREQLGNGIETLPEAIVEEGTSLFPKAPVIRSHGLYYLHKNWVYETHILEQIRRLRQRVPSFIDQDRLEFSGQLLPAQSNAIRMAIRQALSVISGGPGTGKTYTAAHLVKLLFSSRRKEELYVSIAAPTGKAASHLQSTLIAHGCNDPRLHIEASTLHRLLKLQPGSCRLFQNEKIDADLILVDEASMVDVSMMAHLLEAVGDETFVVLIGDPNQLPPVDAGTVFPEMSQCFGAALDRCMRTEDRHLQALAEAVLKGGVDEFFLENPVSGDPISKDKLYSRIAPVVGLEQPDPRACLERYARFRILNAVRKGPEGADAINAGIFQKLKSSGKWWAAPILATVNDPFSELYNGMSGLLIGQGEKMDSAYFLDSTGALRCYPSPPPFELAFCLSIHKSQGSEFEEVLALFPEGSERFGKEALYTAITRAKKRLAIQGKEDAIRRMVSLTTRLQTGLSARIESL